LLLLQNEKYEKITNEKKSAIASKTRYSPHCACDFGRPTTDDSEYPDDLAAITPTTESASIPIMGRCNILSRFFQKSPTTNIIATSGSRITTP
jgi:hypothetical protein